MYCGLGGRRSREERIEKDGKGEEMDIPVVTPFLPAVDDGCRGFGIRRSSTGTIPPLLPSVMLIRQLAVEFETQCTQRGRWLREP